MSWNNIIPAEVLLTDTRKEMATKPRRSTTLNNILPAEKKVKMPDVEHVVIDGDSAIYAVAWGPKSQKEMERLYDQEMTNIMESLETPAATVYVKGKDKTEIYIAYLEACGSSPQTAEYAAIAREIVVQRTANFSKLPGKVEKIVWEDSNPNGFSSIYVY